MKVSSMKHSDSSSLPRSLRSRASAGSGGDRSDTAGSGRASRPTAPQCARSRECRSIPRGSFARDVHAHPRGVGARQAAVRVAPIAHASAPFPFPRQARHVQTDQESPMEALSTRGQTIYMLPYRVWYRVGARKSRASRRSTIASRERPA